MQYLTDSQVGVRKTLLNKTYHNLCKLLPATEIPIPALWERVIGPRSGSLVLDFQHHLERAEKTITATKAALALPWTTTRNDVTEVTRTGQFLTLTINWPPQYQIADIAFNPATFSQHKPWTDGKLALGVCVSTRTQVDKHGQVADRSLWSPVTIGLDHESPHVLVAGASGGGKTETIKTILAQFAKMHIANEKWRIVMCAGRGIKEYLAFRNIYGLVGPLATTRRNIAGALFWVCQLIDDRMQNRAPTDSHVVVIMDDTQEFASECDEIAQMMGRIARQGRGVQIHLIVATQRPSQEMMGDRTVRGNLQAAYTIALRTGRVEETVLIFGNAQEYKAHKLNGHGDALIVSRRGHMRTQIFTTPPAVIRDITGARPELTAWPDYDPTLFEFIENGIEDYAGKLEFSAEEIGLAWHCAETGLSRDGVDGWRATFKREGVAISNSRLTALRGLIEDARVVYASVQT